MIMYQAFRGNQEQNIIESIQKIVFDFLKLQYQAFNVQILPQEYIRTIFIPTKHPNTNRNYYIGHGFGGTSLMFFTVLHQLLLTGNVILWEIRGMGVSKKLQKYQINTLEQIQNFYLLNINKLLSYYKHKNITFICHSLSAYFVQLFAIRQPLIAKQFIDSLVLFSPIGITPKELDYKSSIHGISDIFHTLLNKFGWAFNLTYKSVLRTICRCCKESIIQSSLSSTDFSQDQKVIMSKVIQTLVKLPDGSQDLFFNLFEPRVLPKISLEPLFDHEPQIKTTMIFGGEQDWVDKSAPKRLSQKYPEKIRLIIMEEQGHNFPFRKQTCIKVFKSLFQAEKLI